MNFRSKLLAGAIMLAAVPVTAANAQEAVPGTEAYELNQLALKFGLRAAVQSISLSPDGTKIAFIGAGPEHTEILKVIDLSGSADIKSIASNTEIIGDLEWCEWITDTRLACQITGMAEGSDGTLVPFDRMFAVDSDGKNAKELTPRRTLRALGFNQDGGDIVALDVPDEDGRILVTRNYVPESTMGTRLANEDSGLGVDLLDIETGRRKKVESADEAATRYIADDSGEIRLKRRMPIDSSGRLSGDSVYLYRSKGSRSWKQFENVTLNGDRLEDFYPVAVDSAGDKAIAFITINGFDALIEIALDGTDKASLLLAREGTDIDSLIRIGRKRRVVGASYATEKRSVEYFDKELAALARDLSAALPDTPLINIVGASADESKLLIVASSDTDPGMVYLFDKASFALEPLLPVRDYLETQPMGKMKPISFAAGDGTQIPGYLTLPPGSAGKNLPAIVLPHGGPSARDEWGFDWLVQFFTSRGYAVLQPNYRGSSGYGEDWYGRNGFKAWDVAIGDVNDAGRWLVEQGIADADKLAIAGWSYGGYAALQSQAVAPELYKAVVAIAPVTDLQYIKDDAKDYTNSKIVAQFVGSGPHVDAGSPRRHADKFSSPVALFHATRDINVDVRHSRAMADALKDAGKSVVYKEYDDLQHGLEDSAVRVEMLEEIDRFLAKALERNSG